MRHSHGLSDRTRVLVLMGGWSSEREVSLKSGQAVLNALKELPYDVVQCDPPRDLTRFAAQLVQARPDVIFNALHGTGGEDGIIAGALEMAGITYTHSGVAASSLAMDKNLTKMIARQNGVAVADDVILRRGALAEGHPLPPPYVVKPLRDGSSVGISIVRDDAHNAAQDGDANALVMAERYIEGLELTVGVLETENGPQVLGITQLQPKTGFYDYAAKYTNGMTEHIVNPGLPHDVQQALHKAALTMHRVIGCRDVSRSDFRYNEKDGPVFLEINTHPGLTSLSLLPEQAAAKGIDFNRLVVTLLEQALRRSAARPFSEIKETAQSGEIQAGN